MARRNRSTLKNFFSPGSLPTHEQFGDLIESTLNLVDEGFDKSAENGLEISQIGHHDSLVSFCRADAPKQPVWTIKYDGDNDQLLFKGKNGQSSLSLVQGGLVGVNRKDPACSLDVNGTIRSHGRIGVEIKVEADGEWKSIVKDLTGCQAFEVMAGVGKKHTGKYALVHAIALNAYNPQGWFFNLFNKKKRIRMTHSYYRSRSDKLRLRWKEEGEGYSLQIRTNSNYKTRDKDDVWICCQVTRLWFDETMKESSIPKEPAAQGSKHD